MDGIEANGEGRQAADHGKRTRRQWTSEISDGSCARPQRAGCGEAGGRASATVFT